MLLFNITMLLIANSMFLKFYATSTLGAAGFVRSSAHTISLKTLRVRRKNTR